MSDFQQQLRSILGDPAAMDQIMAMARTLTQPGPGGKQEPDFVPVEPEQPSAPDAAPEGASPLPDLAALLASLGGEGAAAPDPRLLQIAADVFSAYSTRDHEQAALLDALVPFLSPDRQAKMEKAEHIVRLIRALRTGYRLWQEDAPHV